MKTKLETGDELLQPEDAVKTYLSALLNDSSRVVVSEHEISDTVPKLDRSDTLLEQGEHSPDFVVPSWAAKRFANSVIRVCGLNLLIPTQFVRSVRRIHQPILPVTKNTSWLKGRYREEQENILVINTKFLAYGREEFIPPKHRDDKDVYVVVVGNGQWGFSCESIGHGINLSSKEVSWRGRQRKRRWLAGTSVDNKSAIIDVRRVELSLIMDGVLV